MYRDGVPMATAGGGSIPVSTNNAVIGGSSSGGDAFLGLIKRVKLHAIAMSDTDIAAEFLGCSSQDAYASVMSAGRQASCTSCLPCSAGSFRLGCGCDT